VVRRDDPASRAARFAASTSLAVGVLALIVHVAAAPIAPSRTR
jgi:hypothetical protein